MSPILVTGATGRLGQLIVERLLAQQRPVRVLTRRPDMARKLFGPAVEVASGAFADRRSLETALRGIATVLLLSPIGEWLVLDQTAVVDAAQAAGVRRIVKISGSDWTIEPPGRSISGDAHAAVERHLSRLPLEHVSLRPNAWMQVSLANTLRQVLAGEPVTAVNLDAGVGYIDARDIADVAVHLLLADRIAGGPLNLTGPAAKTPRQIAGLLATAIGRRVEAVERQPPPLLPDAGFEQRAVAQFATLIAAGHAAVTTDVVRSLLARPPRSVEAFLSNQLSAEAVLAPTADIAP
ncbi:uncharacterized protein YbjT (DUF2867 family) [Rhizobium sp. PP-F2F-G36]|nr:uncharacterized protein YbjT (DUF2867 family) [Rhizobium sp. PP-F2F-G36]